MESEEDMLARLISKIGRVLVMGKIQTDEEYEAVRWAMNFMLDYANKKRSEEWKES